MRAGAGERPPGDLEDLLSVLDPQRMYETIGRRHDDARESYSVPALNDLTAGAVLGILGEYTRRHLEHAGEDRLSPAAATDLAIELLRQSGAPGLFSDGFIASLACGLEKTPGGLPAVVNALADALKERAVRNHVDTLFFLRVNTLARDDRTRLAELLRARLHEGLRRIGATWAEAEGLSPTGDLLHLARKAEGLLRSHRLRSGDR